MREILLPYKQPWSMQTIRFQGSGTRFTGKRRHTTVGRLIQKIRQRWKLQKNMLLIELLKLWGVPRMRSIRCTKLPLL